MISGLGISSSVVASSIPPPAKARATMDTMGRQIATGQRVSSVKDDGAAWARASAERAASSQRHLLADGLDVLGAGVSWARQTGEVRATQVAQMRGLALAATAPGQSASARAALQAEHDEVYQSFRKNSYGTMGTDLRLNNPSGSAWAPYAESTATNSELQWTADIDGSIATTGVFPLIAPASNTLQDISTEALAATTLAGLTVFEGVFQQRVADVAALERRLDRTSTQLRERADQGSRLAASLTDADLGKASAARAQADTRQQLALGTIRQALDAYGAYAGGLLGNVQRTQRGIMA
jgi:flagellin